MPETTQRAITEENNFWIAAMMTQSLDIITLVMCRSSPYNTCKPFVNI